MSDSSDRPVVLAVEHLTKHFGPVTALRDVSFEVRAAEVVGLIGDNGAGKSTLVNIVAGSLRPDEGHVIVDGERCSFANPSDASSAGIETVFQNLALVPTLNIWENIYLGREQLRHGPVGKLFRSIDKRTMRRDVTAAFERFGVALPPLRTKVSALSGGQRQQVALTRTVLWGSHIVLLDEPASALGVRQTELVLNLVEKLKAHGVGLIFISHNMQHILRVADRVVVLFLGEKVGDRVVRRDTQPWELVALMTGSDPGNGVAPVDAKQLRPLRPRA